MYLTDEVLAQFQVNWDAAKATIQQEASNFGQKKDKLFAVENWNRRSEDIKSVINEVAKILDPQGVPWTLRVGKCIGNARPSGMLEDFLGQEVVRAFWN